MCIADVPEPQATPLPAGLATSSSLPTGETTTASTVPAQQPARQTSANVPVTGRTSRMVDESSLLPSRPAVQQPARRAPNDTGANDEQVNAVAMHCRA